MAYRLIIAVLLYWNTSSFAQDEVFHVVDHGGLNQGTLQMIASAEHIYQIGSTICSTGECMMLNQYTHTGELLFSQVYDEVDVNSFFCGNVLNDSTFFVAALAKERAKNIRLLHIDTDGEIRENITITRDEELEDEWPVDGVFLDDYFFLVVHNRFLFDTRFANIYKIDYSGNILGYQMLGDKDPRTTLYSLKLLDNGNLFVSQPYLDRSECYAFDSDRPNTCLLYTSPSPRD